MTGRRKQSKPAPWKKARVDANEDSAEDNADVQVSNEEEDEDVIMGDADRIEAQGMQAGQQLVVLAGNAEVVVNRDPEDAVAAQANAAVEGDEQEREADIVIADMALRMGIQDRADAALWGVSQEVWRIYVWFKPIKAIIGYVRIPSSGSISMLKRAICRAAAGTAWPSMQVLTKFGLTQELHETVPAAAGAASTSRGSPPGREARLDHYNIKDMDPVELQLRAPSEQEIQEHRLNTMLHHAQPGARDALETAAAQAVQAPAAQPINNILSPRPGPVGTGTIGAAARRQGPPARVHASGSEGEDGEELGEEDEERRGGGGGGGGGGGVHRGRRLAPRKKWSQRELDVLLDLIQEHGEHYALIAERIKRHVAGLKPLGVPLQWQVRDKWRNLVKGLQRGTKRESEATLQRVRQVLQGLGVAVEAQSEGEEIEDDDS